MIAKYTRQKHFYARKINIWVALNPGLALTGFRTTRPRGLFVKSPGKFSGPAKLFLRPWQTRKHCCGNIVAHDVSLCAQTGKHLLRTQSVSEQNQKHFLCPQQMFRARANGEIFVSATKGPQKCVLVCQGL